MSAERCPVRILQKRVWREGLVTLRTEKPENFTFTPGQFVRLGLQTEENGYVSRAYSLASQPSDPFLEFFIVEVRGGALSPRLVRAEAGSSLFLEPELWGSLLAERLPAADNLWCLSSGTGLAPFLSILRESSTWEKWPQIVLVHSVRLAEDLAYTDLIEKIRSDASLASRAGRALIYIPVVTREATQFLSRRIPALLEAGVLQDEARLKLEADHSCVLLCGNPDMIKETRALLKPKGFKAPRRAAPGNLIAENLWND